MLNQIMLVINPLTDDGNWVTLTEREIDNVVIKEQLITRTKGFDTLTFRIPLNNPKVQYLQPERIIRVNGERDYRIRVITRDKARTRRATVECESLWYDLSNGAPKNHLNPSRLTAEEALEELLADTDWTVGEVTVTERHAYTMHDFVSTLYLLRYVQRLFNGEMTFDTVNKKVNLLERAGKDTNITVSYDRNLEGIARIDDTTKLTTRVYMYGRDNLTIADINGGLDYIEDYTWYDEQGIPRQIKTHTITDERFTIMESMKDYMQNYLDTYSYPAITYEVDQLHIDVNLDIGDSIRIFDVDLGKDAIHRVVEKKVNLIRPNASTYTFDFALSDLSDESIGTDEYLIGSDENIEDINTDLQDHINNQIRHVTADERDTWENAATDAASALSTAIVANNNATTALNTANGAASTAQSAQQTANTAQTNITNHLADNVRHITADERTKWNAASDASATLATRVTNLETFETEARTTIAMQNDAITDLISRVTALEGG